MSSGVGWEVDPNYETRARTRLFASPWTIINVVTGRKWADVKAAA